MRSEKNNPAEHLGGKNILPTRLLKKNAHQKSPPPPTPQELNGRRGLISLPLFVLF